jgi:hypothetical protein
MCRCGILIGLQVGLPLAMIVAVLDGDLSSAAGLPKLTDWRRRETNIA